MAGSSQGRRVQSGAGAGSAAAVEALRGLIRIVVLTLSDAATAPLRAGALGGGGDNAPSLAAVDSASQALAVLEGFGRRAAEHGQGLPEETAPDAPAPLPQVLPFDLVCSNVP